MHLPAMMGLVLKQMRQQIIHPVVLLSVTTIHHHDARQILCRQRGNKRQQLRVAICLSKDQIVKRKQSPRFVQRGAIQPVTLHCVDVETINQKDVVQRRPDRREEPAARCDIVGRRQSGAGPVQPMIGKAVHLRQLAPSSARVG